MYTDTDTDFQTFDHRYLEELQYLANTRVIVLRNITGFIYFTHSLPTGFTHNLQEIVIKEVLFYTNATNVTLTLSANIT